MKKHLTCLAAACAVAFSCVACAASASSATPKEAKVPADKSKFHVIVLMGQSNMEGAGYPVPSEYIKGVPNVLRMNDKMEWKQADLVMGPSSGLSPGYVFARKYADMHPGITVGFIQCAVGGKSLAALGSGRGAERQSNGKTIYENAIEKIKAAQQVGVIKAVLWHQGESDSGKQDYVPALNEYVTKLRADINEPDVPFIAGELGQYQSWMNGFNQRIQALPSTIKNSALASTKGMKDRGDELHLSGFSAYLFGCRYFQKYLEMKEPALAKKFEPKLKEIETEMFKKDNEWDIIYNGDMSLGEGRPLGWDARYYGQTGTLEGFKDTKTFVSKGASLRVESIGGPVTNQVGTCIRNVKGSRIRVTCYIKNEGFTECTLNFFGLNGGFQTDTNKVLVNGKDAKEWTKFTAEMDVPMSSIRNRLYFNVKGEGKAWLDDVTVEKISK